MATTRKIYRCWCPMTDTDCPKVNAYLAKRQTEEDARRAVKHHLTHSTYHQMEEDDAQLMADCAFVQSEEEEEWQQEGKGKGKGKGLPAPATPPEALLYPSASSTGQIQMTRAIEQAIVNVQQRGQKRDFEMESRKVNIPLAPASAITISREMASTIADTLGRAEQTASQGAAIAESAAAAFRKEADNLRRLKAYVDNKLR